MNTPRFRLSRAVGPMVLAGAFLVAPRSWAQLPLAQQIVISPLEVPLVVPPPSEAPLIGLVPPGAAPLPPSDEPETNDQGVYDPADWFAVYTGAVYPGKAWTHHHAYRKLTRSWYQVLRAKPLVQSWFQQGSLGAFEIRYCSDPIPGPLVYAKRATVVAADGTGVAEVYALPPKEFRYRMAELKEFFGRPIYLSPANLRQERLLPAANTVIEGAAFAFGIVKVRADAAVTAGVFTDAAPKGDGSYGYRGLVPADFIGPLDLVDSYHDADALLKYTKTLPPRDVSKSYLGPQVLYVNGNFSLDRRGVIQGPAAIVATGTIDLGPKALIGDNVTFIAAQQVTVLPDACLGRDTFLYGMRRLEVHSGAQMASGLVLGLGEVLIKEKCWIGDVLVCGYSRVRVQNGSIVHGSVISVEDAEIGGGK